MFYKTGVNDEFGCVTGALGPARLPLPAIGIAMEESALGWKLCRLSEDIMILADCLAESKPNDTWSRILKHMHGILLRRLGIVRQSPGINGQEPSWHSNVNLVTGVSVTWPNGVFSPGQAERSCVVA